MDDALLENAKKAAFERGITLTALIEQGVRLAMAQGKRKAGVPAVPSGDGVH